MKNRIFTVACLAFISALICSTAQAKDSIISLKSEHNVQVTGDKLVKILQKKGMTVFARIDHSLGAKKTEQELRPTELVIFGNPKVGTPLMQCAQTVAIDLPQKALIWEDEKGDVWLSYNNPTYIAARHSIKGCQSALNTITGALAKFASKATSK